MGKRNDAFEVKDIRIYNRIFPYLMPKRTDSLVYYPMSIDMTRSVNFIRLRNKQAGEKKYHLFDLIMAALVRTFALKPALNRFIMGSKFWQRNNLSFNFVIKTGYNEEADERNAVVTFEPDMVFEEIAAIMRQTINSIRRSEEAEEEGILKMLLRLPPWMLRLVIGTLRRLDRIGRYPKSLRAIDGLHVSAFVANLGSINIPNAPYHHLYDWGTTSLFITFGKLHRTKDIKKDGTDQITDRIDFGITLDERIAEGFYFMRAMNLMRYFLENPHMLENPPDLDGVIGKVSQ